MLAPSVDADGETTTPAREAIAALERLIDGRDPNVVSRDYGIIYQFCADIEIQINAAYTCSEAAKNEATSHFQQMMQLVGEVRTAKSLLDECKKEIAALATSARAVCIRLEELDPTELRAELMA